jgi:hypothetical protein
MFRVNAWTWKGPKHAPCVSPDADWKTAEEIEQVFRELYHVLLDQNDFKLMGSTIEFFLPRELMHWNVENWEVRLWKTPSSKDSEKITLYKLGRTHPVVIRWRDRYRYQDYHNLLYRWQERWKALITTGNADYTRCVLKVPCQDKYSKTTIEEVKQELLSNEDVGFTILMAPPYLDDPTEPEILKPILELGTPIVLWIKQTHHPAEWLQKELYGLLPQSLIVDLPLAVKQRRVSAKRDDETDIGHHLSLLWDDPDRLPPIPSDLTPPSRA